MDKTISKDKVLAALVWVFFKYFTTGVVAQAGKSPDAMEPKDIKMLMLEHFGNISKVFNKEAFYSIARMNYEADTMEELLRGFVKPGTTDMDLVRFACKTDSFYNMMVEEYKRNFHILLNGRIATSEEHEETYTRCEEAGEMDYALAEDIINRMATNAYNEGLGIGRLGNKDATKNV